MMDSHDDRRTAAISRINEKRDFRTHALVYFAVNVMLIVIWAATGAGYFWPIWPIAGWGLGLALHAWQTFGGKPISEAEINEEMRYVDTLS